VIFSHQKVPPYLTLITAIKIHGCSRVTGHGNVYELRRDFGIHPSRHPFSKRGDEFPLSQNLEIESHTILTILLVEKFNLGSRICFHIPCSIAWSNKFHRHRNLTFPF
jgi:phosphoribosylaminoimidazole (AIR) synthetase